MYMVGGSMLYLILLIGWNLDVGGSIFCSLPFLIIRFAFLCIHPVYYGA